MPAKISILHLEDSHLDAEFVRDRLVRSGLEVEIDHVVDKRDFVECLKRQTYDVILSDYRVPTFQDLEALDLARRLQPRTPFLFISGTMGEELAVETLRRGATDYILKERLTRLPIAIERSLTEARERDELHDAELALAESEARFRQLANTIPNLAWMARPDGHIFWYNNRWYEYTGTTLADMEGWGWQAVHDPAVLPRVIDRWKHSLDSGQPFEMVFPLRGADGQSRPFLTLVSPLRDDTGTILYWFGTNTEITAQKRAEEQLLQVARHETYRAELLGRLASAARTINSVRSLQEMLEAIAHEARALLKAESAVVTVIEANHSERTKVACSPPQTTLNHPTPELSPSGTLPVLHAPLCGQAGRELGDIRIVRQPGSAFTEEDQAVLSQLAAIAAVSVENARLYESLRTQDRQKDEFLATLAHELRNPLAPIRNSVHILRHTAGDDSSTVQVCDMLDRQVNHMVRLVDDLLEISRITRNRIELKLEEVDLTTVVQNAVETSRPLIEGAGHQLDIALPDTSLWVRGDMVRLSQIVANLLNNAAKYTNAEGRIWLTVQPDGTDAVISVRDTGIGIPPEMLSRVFEMFVQVNRSGTRAQGGLGIGLSLVQNLVHMHGGTVEAKSAGIGQGSEFLVRFPLVARQGLPSVRPCDGASQMLWGRRVLVVDDNHDAANSLAMLLRALGVDVHAVYDGESALSAVDEFRPELILLDLGMPGMDGFEVAEQLHQRPSFAKTKLVALTGWGQDHDRRRVFSAGFHHHLVKPAEIEQIKTLLASLDRSS